ncbi:MAG: integration host factor subunit alpha [Candidatus Tectomicrobia bacterium]|uniref:Integration host factor subunit alpha n=1 Tax=Tectimicrobiota bacterium TaxID=2528274 RepID=A0A932CNQ3_UNCTE|nr:integration host factor subunit alpha [Candidatus Tectomicrobia bacterium]
MVKADLRDQVYEKVGFSKNEASDVIEAVFDVVKDTLKSGERVQIAGFGIFDIREKGKRVGRNPKTGEEIVISPRKVLTFKPSKILRDEVNR